MFRLSCMIEDKRLPEVLKLLAGKVVDMDPPQPVVVNNGAANGRELPKLAQFVMQMPKEFSTEDLREKLRASGIKSKSAASNALQTAKKQKLVKRAGFSRWRLV